MPARKAKKSRHLDAGHLLPELIRRMLSIQDPDDLLPQVLGLCRNFLGCDEVSLLILSEDGREIVEHTVAGARLRPTGHRVLVGEQGVTGWVAARRRAQVVADVRKDKRYIPVVADRRSEAAVPIASGERLLGVLNFESNVPGFFTPSDLPLLEFVASQVAIALRVLELHDSEDALRDRLAMLHHLSRLSGGFLPADQFLSRVADVTRRTLGCYYIGIFQGDYERQEVVLLAHACSEPLHFRAGDTQKFGSGLIGKAFEIGEIMNARDVSKEPAYVEKLKAVKSEVCIPIRVGDHCLGILDAQGAKVEQFSPDDLMALETMARFLVPTVQNAKVTTA